MARPLHTQMLLSTAVVLLLGPLLPVTYATFWMKKPVTYVYPKGGDYGGYSKGGNYGGGYEHAASPVYVVPIITPLHYGGIEHNGVYGHAGYGHANYGGHDGYSGGYGHGAYGGHDGYGGYGQGGYGGEHTYYASSYMSGHQGGNDYRAEMPLSPHNVHVTHQGPAPPAHLIMPAPMSQDIKLPMHTSQDMKIPMHMPMTA